MHICASNKRVFFSFQKVERQLLLSSSHWLSKDCLSLSSSTKQPATLLHIMAQRPAHALTFPMAVTMTLQSRQTLQLQKSLVVGMLVVPQHLSVDFLLTFISSCLGKAKWQPTPVFLLGESHGWRSLVVAKSRTQLSDFTSLHHIFITDFNCGASHKLRGIERNKYPRKEKVKQ